MAIGDNYNDIEMLEFAGYPVIMGNACAELLGRGWKVTRGNDACGVAGAVEWAMDGEDEAEPARSEVEGAIGPRVSADQQQAPAKTGSRVTGSSSVKTE
jgi:hypothetical protein